MLLYNSENGFKKSDCENCTDLKESSCDTPSPNKLVHVIWLGDLTVPVKVMRQVRDTLFPDRTVGSDTLTCRDGRATACRQI